MGSVQQLTYKGALEHHRLDTEPCQMARQLRVATRAREPGSQPLERPEQARAVRLTVNRGQAILHRVGPAGQPALVALGELIMVGAHHIQDVVGALDPFDGRAIVGSLGRAGVEVHSDPPGTGWSLVHIWGPLSAKARSV